MLDYTLVRGADDLDLDVEIDAADGPIRVDWGDGTGETLAAAPATPSHTYPKAGNYRVALRDNTASGSEAVTIGRPARASVAFAEAERAQRAAAELAGNAALTGRLG